MRSTTPQGSEEGKQSLLVLMTTRRLGAAAAGLLAGMALHEALDQKPRRYADPRLEAAEHARRRRELAVLRSRAAKYARRAATAVSQTFAEMAKATRSAPEHVSAIPPEAARRDASDASPVLSLLLKSENTQRNQTGINGAAQKPPFKVLETKKDLLRLLRHYENLPDTEFWKTTGIEGIHNKLATLAKQEEQAYKERSKVEWAE